MTGNQQLETLNWFKSPGRKALVATRAAEEGIDVVSCELVVRYSVTTTGIPKNAIAKNLFTTSMPLLNILFSWLCE